MDTTHIEKKQVLMVAHRGLSGIEVENTAASFVAAGNRSYYGIETDIWKTTDGKYAAIHDPNLLRLAGVDRNVTEMSMAELQETILFDKDGTKDRLDLRPGTLQNYLSICKKYEKQCILELKGPFSEADIGEIIDIIRSYDYLDQVTFISGHYDNLTVIRRYLPGHSVQLVFSKITDELTQRLIADRIDIDVRYTALTPENIAQFHAAGLKVNCWTVNEKEDAQRLIAWGVDYITTNILE